MQKSDSYVSMSATTINTLTCIYFLKYKLQSLKSLHAFSSEINLFFFFWLKREARCHPILLQGSSEIINSAHNKQRVTAMYQCQQHQLTHFHIARPRDKSACKETNSNRNSLEDTPNKNLPSKKGHPKILKKAIVFYHCQTRKMNSSYLFLLVGS